ncbi:deoxyribodipyrimidine photolyase [Vibrio ishigakensis]|uniref:Deoxyribodipyrimidine photolyase n=1 Tax=Vibrio ishigakensis TaxID=1481914 RepID=A0A0B8QH22_9VIBR|nr:deoxyribodipyrimidine photolyase [Vibrio ishigakensis]
MNHLVWFRRDLRTLDNSALQQALERASMLEGSNVVALFIETPDQWQEHNLAPIQADLIQRRLHEVSAELQDLNVSLIVERCDSFAECAEVISRLCQQHSINQLWANKEYELNEVKRDEIVAETSPIRALSLDSSMTAVCLHPERC